MKVKIPKRVEIEERNAGKTWETRDIYLPISLNRKEDCQ